MSEITPRTPSELASLAEEINAEHRFCEAATESAFEHARRAGEKLIEAKVKTQHGGWGEWLRANFEGSTRTAQTYMRVAREWPRLA